MSTDSPGTRTRINRLRIAEFLIGAALIGGFSAYTTLNVMKSQMLAIQTTIKDSTDIISEIAKKVGDVRETVAEVRSDSKNLEENFETWRTETLESIDELAKRVRTLEAKTNGAAVPLE